jgi:hypothetical protein
LLADWTAAALACWTFTVELTPPAVPSVIVIVPTPLAGTMFPVMLELSVPPWPEIVPAVTASSRWLPTVSA